MKKANSSESSQEEQNTSGAQGQYLMTRKNLIKYLHEISQSDFEVSQMTSTSYHGSASVLPNPSIKEKVSNIYPSGKMALVVKQFPSNKMTIRRPCATVHIFHRHIESYASDISITFLCEILYLLWRVAIRQI